MVMEIKLKDGRTRFVTEEHYRELLDKRIDFEVVRRNV